MSVGVVPGSGGHPSIVACSLHQFLMARVQASSAGAHWLACESPLRLFRGPALSIRHTEASLSGAGAPLLIRHAFCRGGISVAAAAMRGSSPSNPVLLPR